MSKITLTIEDTDDGVFTTWDFGERGFPKEEEEVTPAIKMASLIQDLIRFIELMSETSH